MDADLLCQKYKKITTITILTAIVNLVLNLLLIPKYGGVGAATAYLITTMFQASAYYSVVNKHLANLSLWPIIKFIIIAAVVYAGALSIDMHVVLKLLVSVSAYLYYVLLQAV